MATIQESGQNYLETILVLSKDGKKIRSVDIASALDYSRPSVSVAVKKLRQEGYIETDQDGFIILTESGKKIAEAVHERHIFLSNWLISLGVNEQVAIEDACKIEHILSNQSFEAIRTSIGDEPC